MPAVGWFGSVWWVGNACKLEAHHRLEVVSMTTMCNCAIVQMTKCKVQLFKSCKNCSLFFSVFLFKFVHLCVDFEDLEKYDMQCRNLVS